MDSRVQHFVICQFSIIFLLSYNFLQFDDFIIYFQDIYNNSLKERYEDDPSTHPNLICGWRQDRSVGPIEIIYTDSLTLQPRSLDNPQCVDYQMLAIGSEYSISQVQVILDRRVHDQMTYLNKKYKRLIVDYEELCRVVMEMRSHMGGPCAPPYWPHGPDNNQPPPPLPVPSLFQIYCI